jgi:secretion/DNA translocation related CpaE-like protein
MGETGRIVVVTAREDLRTSVARLAALVGAETEVVGSSASVRGVWRTARVVVVGCDVAAVVAAAGLPRRGEVVVVGDVEPDPGLWRAAVELGATRLLVLPAGERELVELISAAFDLTASGGSTVAVIGGCGGAGASTFAVALAVTIARETAAVLVDGDGLGGGLDVVLGAEQQPGARWPDLAATRGRLGAAALAQALVQVADLAVLSWDRSGSVDVAPPAAAAVMDAAVRAFPWVVVDLPRRFDATSMAFASAADVVMMVVPATVRATAAAAAAATQLRDRCGSIQLVVRDAGSGRLTTAEVAAALGLPVAASFHSESTVAVAADRGEAPLRRSRGSLHDACRAVLAIASTPVSAAAA